MLLGFPELDLPLRPCPPATGTGAWQLPPPSASPRQGIWPSRDVRSPRRETPYRGLQWQPGSPAPCPARALTFDQAAESSAWNAAEPDTVTHEPPSRSCRSPDGGEQVEPRTCATRDCGASPGAGNPLLQGRSRMRAATAPKIDELSAIERHRRGRKSRSRTSCKLPASPPTGSCDAQTEPPLIHVKGPARPRRKLP